MSADLLIRLSCGCASTNPAFVASVEVGDVVWCHEHPKDETELDQVTVVSIEAA